VQFFDTTVLNIPILLAEHQTHSNKDTTKALKVNSDVLYCVVLDCVQKEYYLIFFLGIFCSEYDFNFPLCKTQKEHKKCNLNDSSSLALRK
jgi:hypothetical protein